MILSSARPANHHRALAAGEGAGQLSNRILERHRYIRRHLEHAGRPDTLFSDDAVRAIHAHARGLPRAINRLAVTALLAACATGKTIVDESAARTAINEEAAAATD